MIWFVVIVAITHNKPSSQHLNLLRPFKMFSAIKRWIFCQEVKKASKQYISKGHLFCKPCLHDIQFIKTRYFSRNLSKLARADISCQFKKPRYLCRHCLQNEWTLDVVVGYSYRFERKEWYVIVVGSCLLLRSLAYGVKCCIFWLDDLKTFHNCFWDKNEKIDHKLFKVLFHLEEPLLNIQAKCHEKVILWLCP